MGVEKIQVHVFYLYHKSTYLMTKMSVRVVENLISPQFVLYRYFWGANIN